jgi:hypothetical protein
MYLTLSQRTVEFQGVTILSAKLCLRISVLHLLLSNFKSCPLVILDAPAALGSKVSTFPLVYPFKHLDHIPPKSDLFRLKLSSLLINADDRAGWSSSRFLCTHGTWVKTQKSTKISHFGLYHFLAPKGENPVNIANI